MNLSRPVFPDADLSPASVVLRICSDSGHSVGQLRVLDPINVSRPVRGGGSTTLVGQLHSETTCPDPPDNPFSPLSRSSPRLSGVRSARREGQIRRDTLDETTSPVLCQSRPVRVPSRIRPFVPIQTTCPVPHPGRRQAKPALRKTNPVPVPSSPVIRVRVHFLGLFSMKQRVPSRSRSRLSPSSARFREGGPIFVSRPIAGASTGLAQRITTRPRGIIAPIKKNPHPGGFFSGARRHLSPERTMTVSRREIPGSLDKRALWHLRAGRMHSSSAPRADEPARNESLCSSCHTRPIRPRSVFYARRILSVRR
jgi:hypothetical protein